MSLKKTNVLGQDTAAPPVITIGDHELDVVHQFTYLGFTITDNLSLDTEIDKRIGKAATTFARSLEVEKHPEPTTEVGGTEAGASGRDEASTTLTAVQSL